MFVATDISCVTEIGYLGMGHFDKNPVYTLFPAFSLVGSPTKGPAVFHLASTDKSYSSLGKF